MANEYGVFHISAVVLYRNNGHYRSGHVRVLLLSYDVHVTSVDIKMHMFTISIQIDAFCVYKV